jgi:hypothetical protein
MEGKAAAAGGGGRGAAAAGGGRERKGAADDVVAGGPAAAAAGGGGAISGIATGLDTPALVVVRDAEGNFVETEEELKRREEMAK